MAVIGYYSMIEGQGVDAMRDDIIAAGHTPVAIITPDATELSGIDALYVWNGSNDGYDPEFLGHMPDITAAMQGGMNMVVFDRAVGVANPQTVLPGTQLTHVRATTADADLTAAGEDSVGAGPGGTITDASLDGGSFTTHGYVDAATLPAGSTVLMTLGGGDESHAVGFLYEFGAGSVQYYGIPMDYYNETNQVWENFAINTLQFAAMCLASGTRVLTARGYRRVETLRAGDLIWTQHHGMQPVLAVIASQLGDCPLVTVPSGIIGNRRDLVVSGQHRLGLSGPWVELFAGVHSAFAVAVHLVGLGGVRARPQPDASMYNLLFAQHECILAEGAVVESLYVSPTTKIAMGRDGRRVVSREGAMALAYPELDRATARAVFAALVGHGQAGAIVKSRNLCVGW